MKKRTAKQKPKTVHRMKIPACKHFTGYKPCFPNTHCYNECVDFDAIGTKILIINLDAMGNVLVTTSLLPALKRKHPVSSIYWITLKNAAPLLQNIPLLDRVYIWEPESWLVLQQMEFDIVLNVDKSHRSCAFTNSLRTKAKLGFGLNKHGQIIPLNKEAHYNFRLGLSDELKFKTNQKTVQQIQCEQFKLKYKRDEYELTLSKEEVEYCAWYKSHHGLDGAGVIVGFNTGCSELYPNKKMTIEQHIALINRLSEMPGIRLVLVGGPEDTQRNAEIARSVGDKVLNTPTTEGVRRGLCYINICDVIISGDSFGMHAAIGLKKQVVVWFGVSCWTEIDLYDRGVKFVPEGLECSPCWKRTCPYNLECIQMIDHDKMIRYVEAYREGAKAPPHDALHPISA
jgi:ADP-heptose:LPS heptosyltransferase